MAEFKFTTTTTTKQEKPIQLWQGSPTRSFEVKCVANGFILTLLQSINYLPVSNLDQRTFIFTTAVEMASWIRKNVK